MRNARSMGVLAAAAALLLAPAARAEEVPPSNATSAPGDRPGEAKPSGAGSATSGRLVEEEEPSGSAGAVSPESDRPVEKPSGPASAVSPESNRPGEVKPSSTANDRSEGSPVVSAATPDPFPAYRFGYVVGGGLALTGAAFGFIAQSEAVRAGTLTSSGESSATLVQARGHAATANLCFTLAAATAVYALVVEFLPRPAADAASLAFRF